MQRGLDLNIIALFPAELTTSKPPTASSAPCQLSRKIVTQNAPPQPDTRSQVLPPRRSKRPASSTWYIEAVNCGQGKMASMQPPSPRRRRSARTAQRNIDTAQARAAEIAAVASASHVVPDGPPGADGTPGLRTRSQTARSLQFSPSAPGSSHETASTVGPATPSPRVVGRTPHSWQQASAFKSSQLAPPAALNEENGQACGNRSQLLLTTSAALASSALCSPRTNGMQGIQLINRQVPEWSSPLGTPSTPALDPCSTLATLPSASQSQLTPVRRAFMQDPALSSSLLHDFPGADALLSPALRAVCSGIDLSRLDGDALLSPIASGLSPLTLSLADLPSPLTALPALVSPCPDALQSPTILPCLPLTPNKMNDLEATLDEGSASLCLWSKSSAETLSNSLRRRAAVTQALTDSFLASPRDAQMINVRDLGATRLSACPCCPRTRLAAAEPLCCVQVPSSCLLGIHTSERRQHKVVCQKVF